MTWEKPGGGLILREFDFEGDRESTVCGGRGELHGLLGLAGLRCAGWLTLYGGGSGDRQLRAAGTAVSSLFGCDVDHGPFAVLVGE